MRLVHRYGYADITEYALFTKHEYYIGEPSYTKEAMGSQDKDEWLEAMKEEMNSLLKNQTLVLV